MEKKYQLNLPIRENKFIEYHLNKLHPLEVLKFIGFIRPWCMEFGQSYWVFEAISDSFLDLLRFFGLIFVFGFD